jgi:hypothetical protein
VLIGVLFWISNLATVIGSAMAGTIPNAHDALTGMSPHGTQVMVGTLIAHINDVAIIAYAVVLFPVLKRFSQGMALGYVAFKALEGTLLVVSAAALLSLIPLSQHYLTSGSDGASLQGSAELALGLQFWAARLASLAYVVATPVLAFVLYRSRLVPRAISIWGFAGVALLVLGLAIGVGDPTRGFQPGQVLVLPILFWELTFATWLIVRGFNPSAVTGEDHVATSVGAAAAPAA